MILCSDEAREKGLCTPDERDLHAKYAITIEPSLPPEAEPAIACQVIKKLNVLPPVSPDSRIIGQGFMGAHLLPTADMNMTDVFGCTYTRTAEGKLELDVVLTGNPDDPTLIASYVLVISVIYDESLLPFKLLARKVEGSDLGDLCVLSWHYGRHPPDGTAKSDDPFGPFMSCEDAMLMQRNLLGIPMDLLRIPMEPINWYTDIRLESPWAKVLPVIDGSMDVGEWSNGMEFCDYDCLYVKNDDDYLYVAYVSDAADGPNFYFSVWLYFDVNLDAVFTEGTDVAYVYFWPSGLGGFIRYSEKCKFLEYGVGKGFIRELEQLVGSSDCLSTLNAPASIRASRDAARIMVEMKIPLRGDEGIMASPGGTVGIVASMGGHAYTDGDGTGFVAMRPAGLARLTLASGPSQQSSRGSQETSESGVDYQVPMLVAVVTSAIIVVSAGVINSKLSRQKIESK
jgi:hypothetical protein